MKFLVLFSFILFLVSVSGQKKMPDHYSYPFDESYKPLTVRANIILLQRNDGSGNFDLKDNEQKQLLLDYLDNVNNIYSKIIMPDDLTGCYIGNDFIADAKIRIEYNILEVKNEFAWNYLNSGAVPEEKKYNGFSPSESWYIKPLDDSIVNSPNIPKGINIYFTSNGERFDKIVEEKAKVYDVSGNAASQFPTDRNLHRSSQTHQPNRYLKYILHRYKLPQQHKTTWEETRNWHLNDAKGFAHELGHSFGLNHSNEYHQANKCKYALMSQAGGDPRNYIQPTEIKKIHWNLTRTNLMQFVTEDSQYGVTWQIEKDTIWDKPRRFYNNFEIAKDVTLTISDSIILPPQSLITLNKNSKIIFKEKGKIVDAYGKEYKSFQKHKTSKILNQ